MKKLICTISAVLMLFFAPSAALASPPAEHPGQGQEQSAEHGRDSAPGQQKTTQSDQPDDGDNKHPSGKDKSVEPGGSGTQGNAQSDPDDDGKGPDRSNGGADKPGGPGGVDKGDQDSNNGCGNDDDFEDDNEGLCGGPDRSESEKPKEVDKPKEEAPRETEKPREQKPAPKPDAPAEKPKAPVENPEPVVEGPAEVETPEPVSVAPEQPVVDVAPTRAATATVSSGEELPRTGADAGLLLLAATGLLGGGATALRKKG